jgi:diaminohydroxyphosphoribosylaminopyrimidine deaminase/5-amino-6-(5-phosphoribosylamino)uracil reductase
MYVTLEPCCHYGKTPPCTDAIIAAKLAKVVVATIDPSAHNNGKGIRELHKAKIEVEVGVCEKQARLLNAPFLKFAATGKSWVILKWAQSVDGRIAYTKASAEQGWISSEQSRKDAHKIRRRVQGILVGINTVIADDPQLTARPAGNKKAVRIVLDSHLKIPLGCKLLATAKKVPVLIATSRQVIEAKSGKAGKIIETGAQLLAVPQRQGKVDLRILLKELAKRGIVQVLIEGGAKVITSFLKQGLVDEICVYIAPKILGRKGRVKISQSMAELAGGAGLDYLDIKQFGDDIRLTGLLKKAGE